MKKIKIGLFVDNNLIEIDGVVAVVKNYAKNLMKYGEVVVVTPTSNKKFNLEKFPYRVIEVKSINVPVAKLRLAVPELDPKIVDELAEEKFDVVHIHSPFSIGKLGIKVAKKLGVPVIGTMHTQFKFEFLKYTKSETVSNLMIKEVVKVYSLCDECWAVNSDTADVYKRYGYKKEVKVMPNATDMELSKGYDVVCSSINKMYDLDEDVPVLLFVGRINEVKNIFFIEEVLKELKKRKTKYKMLFVGAGPDLEKLKKQISDDNLNSNIIFCGSIRDRELLKKIYMRSTLLMFPSLFDTSSLVQIEASSQKTPTIFIKGSVTSETITPEVNGFVAENNINKFTDKVIEILENKEKYEKVSKNAYRQLYVNWKTIVSRAYKNYLKIIDNK